MIDTAFIRSIREGLRQTRKPKEEGTDELSQEYKEMTPGQTDEALDPVNKDAVKKKFKDRKDKDIDNDGDVDSSDKYLHKRRKAISKAMKEMTDAIEALEEKDEVQEARGIRLTPELFKNVKKFGVELEKYAKKSGGIDKDDFMKVAAIAKKGMLPDKSDIPSDTDPRDKVLSMMAGIVGDEILLAFKGLSPSIDNYIKKTMKEGAVGDSDQQHRALVATKAKMLMKKALKSGKSQSQAWWNKQTRLAGLMDSVELEGEELDENKLIKIQGMWSAEVSGDDECKLSYDKPNKDLEKKLAMNWLITGGFDTNTNPKKWAKNGFNFDGHPEFPDLPEYLDIDYLNNGVIIIEKITRYWKKAAEELEMLGIDPKKNINWNGKNPTKKADWKLSQKEEVELDEKRAETPDEWMKRTGKKPTKIGPGTGKEGERQIAMTKKAIQKAASRERELAQKDAKRRYVSKGGGKNTTRNKEYRSPDYVSIKDIKKFPRSLTSGLGKIISGAKLQNDKFKLAYHGLIPGMGITFPGDSAPKLFIEYKVHIFLAGPEPGKITPDTEYSEPGVDTADFKHWMIVYVNEAATNNPALKGKVDWYQRKEFSGKTADEAAKRTLQYLKTKVKRMANEEVEIEENDKAMMMKLTTKAMKAIPNSPQQKELIKQVNVYRKKLGMKPMKEESIVEREMTDNEMKKREEIVMKLKKKMPEFVKRYGDKAKEVMYATATKMAMGEELEPLETKKSKKKDKINLKPEMDENMRTLKDFRNKMQEHCGECGAMDHVEEGPADYLARKGTFEVKYASSKKGPIKVSKFPSLEQAKKFLAQVRKEGMNGIISKGGKPVKEENIEEKKGSDYQLYHKTFSGAMQHAYAVAKKRGYTVDKDDIDNKVASGPRKPSSGKTNRYILGTDKKQNLHVQVANLDNKRFELNMYIESNNVNEAVTGNGVEYGEQEFDAPHRLENAYPNLDVSFAKFMEEDLEGPYMFEGETYFFDRKMGSWFSVSGEDYVDEDMNKHLSHNFIKSELVRVN